MPPLRTAMVEVASSWSAMRTRAAFTAAAGTAAAEAVRRAASRAARESSRSSPAGRGPTTSASAAVARRAARATAAGRRSERSGSVAPHRTSAQRMRSSVGVSGQGPRSGARQSPAASDCQRSSATSSKLDPAASSVAGRPAVDRAELLVELGHRGRDGGQAGGGLAPAPAAHHQPLDVVEVEEAPPPGRVRVRHEQAAADVGVEGRHLDPETAGRLLGGQHAVHPCHLTLT